jgi:ubiquinone/menaquinone biosynthesis C-methylase UbiE
MPKLLHRIVALLLFPCLLQESAQAFFDVIPVKTGIPTTDSRLRGNDNKGIPFTSQALEPTAVGGTGYSLNHRVNSEVQHSETDFEAINRRHGYSQDEQGLWRDKTGVPIQDDSDQVESSDHRLVEFEAYLLSLLRSDGQPIQQVNEMGLGVVKKTGAGAPTFYELADAVHQIAPEAKFVGLDTQQNVLAAAEKAKGNRENIEFILMPTKDFIVPEAARGADLLRAANVIRNYGLPGDRERAIVNLIQGVREGGWLVVIESDGPGQEGYFYTFQRRNGHAVPVAFGFALRNLEYKNDVPFGTSLGGIDFTWMKHKLRKFFYKLPHTQNVEQVRTWLGERGFDNVRQLNENYVVIELTRTPMRPATGAHGPQGYSNAPATSRQAA